MTTVYKVAADKSADAISKVLSILAPVFSSLTVQDGGENALRTKTSFLWLEKLTIKELTNDFISVENLERNPCGSEEY